MPSFGSVTSDQLDADGVAELGAVVADDPDVGAPFAVREPVPGLAALLAVVGLVVAVAAVFFEHPPTAATRRNAVKTATAIRRRRRGGAVKLSTLCVLAGMFRLSGASASMNCAASGAERADSWPKARDWPESAWDERHAIGNSRIEPTSLEAAGALVAHAGLILDEVSPTRSASSQSQLAKPARRPLATLVCLVSASGVRASDCARPPSSQIITAWVTEPSPLGST
jgi:hypothetical protein